MPNTKKQKLPPVGGGNTISASGGGGNNKWRSPGNIQPNVSAGGGGRQGGGRWRKNAAGQGGPGSWGALPPQGGGAQGGGMPRDRQAIHAQRQAERRAGTRPRGMQNQGGMPMDNLQTPLAGGAMGGKGDMGGKGGAPAADPRIMGYMGGIADGGGGRMMR